MKLPHLLTACAVLLTLAPSPAAAQTSAVPAFISYQGRVVDASGANVGTGTPVNRTVIFRIWDNPSSTNTANLIYSEVQTVTVSEGEFSVLVGQGVANPTQTYGYLETSKKLADIGSAFGGNTRYLGVTVASAATIATTDNEITPRQQIVSTAFAMRAKYAEQVGSNGTAALTALDSGRVGIGTLAPPALFTVSGANVSTSTATPQLLVTADDLTERLRIGVDSTNNGTGFIQAFKEGTGVGTGAQNLLLNPNGGNVGIGNTNPAVALSVTGAITATGAITGGSFTTAAGSLATNTGNIGIGTTAPVNRLEIMDGTAVGSYGSVLISRPNTGHLGSHLAFMRSGTSVMGLGYAQGTSIFGFGQGTGGAFSPGYLAIDHNNGKIGIGTTAPSNFLSVEGGGQVETASTSTAVAHFGGGDVHTYFGSYNGTNSYATWMQAMRSSDQLVFPMAINPNGGNVGIGKSNPAYKLDVSGNGRFTGTLTTEAPLVMGTGSQIYGTTAAGGSVPVFWPRAADDATYLNIGSNGWYVRDGANNVRMHMSTGGQVKLGTALGTGLLNVGSIASNVTWYASFGSTGQNLADGINAAQGIGISCGSAIWANVYLAESDSRIKTKLSPTDSVKDLKTLMGIEVTDYQLKDTAANGSAQHKKVIAQQVEKVYPQAVSRQKGVVPDIYQKATVKKGWVQLATDLKVGERVRLMLPSGDSVEDVLEVRSDSFRTSLKTPADELVVYGREVSDFRAVDYTAVSMLNVSATQQLKHEKDAEMQVLREENAALRRELATKDRELAAKDKSVEARLIALERRMSGEGEAKTVSTKTKTAKVAE